MKLSFFVVICFGIGGVKDECSIILHYHYVQFL
jgi:hypothetical protein